MSKKQFCMRAGRLLLVLAVLFALVGTDTAPLTETAEAVTQSDIDNLKDNAEDLADQKSEDLDLADFQVETVETALAEGTVTADALVGAADGSPVDFETLARQKG